MKNEFYCRAWTKSGPMNLSSAEFALSDGIWHREDGPAIEYYDGSNAWYIEGQLHRLDGPAINYVSGMKLRRWYLNGKLLDSYEIEKWLSDTGVDLKTNDGQLAFKLRWA